MEKEKVWIEEYSLFLTGSGGDLNSKETRSILLERQREFEFTAECTISTESLKEGESAGIASYYDENSYIKFGVAVKDGRKGILLAHYVGEEYEELSFTPFPRK